MPLHRSPHIHRQRVIDARRAAERADLVERLRAAFRENAAAAHLEPGPAADGPELMAFSVPWGAGPAARIYTGPVPTITRAGLDALNAIALARATDEARGLGDPADRLPPAGTLHNPPLTSRPFRAVRPGSHSLHDPAQSHDRLDGAEEALFPLRHVSVMLYTSGSVPTGGPDLHSIEVAIEPEHAAALRDRMGDIGDVVMGAVTLGGEVPVMVARATAALRGIGLDVSSPVGDPNLLLVSPLVPDEAEEEPRATWDPLGAHAAVDLEAAAAEEGFGLVAPMPMPGLEESIVRAFDKAFAGKGGLRNDEAGRAALGAAIKEALEDLGVPVLVPPEVLLSVELPREQGPEADVAALAEAAAAGLPTAMDFGAMSDADLLMVQDTPLVGGDAAAIAAGADAEVKRRGLTQEDAADRAAMASMSLGPVPADLVDPPHQHNVTFVGNKAWVDAMHAAGPTPLAMIPGPHSAEDDQAAMAIKPPAEPVDLHGAGVPEVTDDLPRAEKPAAPWQPPLEPAVMPTLQGLDQHGAGFAMRMLEASAAHAAWVLASWNAAGDMPAAVKPLGHSAAAAIARGDQVWTETGEPFLGGKDLSALDRAWAVHARAMLVVAVHRRALGLPEAKWEQPAATWRPWHILAGWPVNWETLELEEQPVCTAAPPVAGPRTRMQVVYADLLGERARAWFNRSAAEDGDDLLPPHAVPYEHALHALRGGLVDGEDMSPIADPSNLPRYTLAEVNDFRRVRALRVLNSLREAEGFDPLPDDTALSPMRQATILLGWTHDLDGFPCDWQAKYARPRPLVALLHALNPRPEVLVHVAESFSLPEPWASAPLPEVPVLTQQVAASHVHEGAQAEGDTRAPEAGVGASPDAVAQAAALYEKELRLRAWHIADHQRFIAGHKVVAGAWEHFTLDDALNILRGQPYEVLHGKPWRGMYPLAEGDRIFAAQQRAYQVRMRAHGDALKCTPVGDTHADIAFAPAFTTAGTAVPVGHPDAVETIFVRDARRLGLSQQQWDDVVRTTVGGKADAPESEDELAPEEQADPAVRSNRIYRAAIAFQEEFDEPAVGFEDRPELVDAILAGQALEWTPEGVKIHPPLPEADKWGAGRRALLILNRWRREHGLGALYHFPAFADQEAILGGLPFEFCAPIEKEEVTLRVPAEVAAAVDANPAGAELALRAQVRRLQRAVEDEREWGLITASRSPGQHERIEHSVHVAFATGDRDFMAAALLAKHFQLLAIGHARRVNDQ